MTTRPFSALKKLKTILWISLLAGAALASLSGCSTTEGFGQDLQRLGEKIEDKAQDTQQPETYDY